MLFSSVLVALGATLVAAVPPLEIKGRHFVNADSGEKFQIVGMAYQPGGSAAYDPKTGKDPLTDADACLRDAALMQALGINAIRVYNLNPDANHDECASIFNAAGMYMMLDVNSPRVGEAIATFEPWTTYYMEYLNRTFAVVEAFANYPNTLLFFSGNEIINDLPSAEQVPPYIRAVARDIKNYIKNNIDRKIPVGYSAADVREVLWDTYNYLQCHIDGDEDDMSRGDIFALNSYSWCGKKATFETSSFDKLVEGFEETPFPVFLSEYGCNETPERWWNETQSIYGDDMYNTFSGGVVYEWTQEKNDYGLVNITDDGTHIMDDYNRLRDQYSLIDWEAVFALKGEDENMVVTECSSSLIKEDGFLSNFTLPKVPPGAQKLIDDGIKNKPSGKIVDISNWKTTLEVFDVEGNPIENLEVVPLGDDEFNWYGKNEISTGNTGGDDEDAETANADQTEADNDEEDGAMVAIPVMWAAALPMLAMLFA